MGRRILVVDDELEIRATLSDYFAGLGDEVVALSSGREALERLAADTRFDAALVDWNMPGISGRDVVQEIGRSAPWIAVVVTTGHVAEQVGRNHLTGLRAEIVHKPFSLRGLAQEVARLVAMPVEVPDDVDDVAIS